MANARTVTRRQAFALTLGAVAVPAVVRAATTERLTFDTLYSSRSALGLEFSELVRSLDGRPVSMRGFMAPPLATTGRFFVLTRSPVALCPFCSSDTDWPDDIVVVYLNAAQPFVQFNRVIDVEGVLSRGSWTDPQTGFVSLLRIVDARFSLV